ncbi:hypothetical protein [Lactiplantibacillus plantarum]|uniref:hypothetical protein n=1 Tax=Lactiplantibacillus plantarum TaxID=1590 RepID=UPI001AAEB0A7|nr:hypothetical protein [Lactiplantibacillus plantarum]MBO2724802.1 hypothetical protein [Lactiplantibacillus plantarum]
MSRFNDHKEAKKQLKDIERYKDRYLIIHYACESFFSTQGRSPHITAIAIKDIASNQTKLFAIHQIAETQHIDFHAIQSDYDNLEKEILKEFFAFVKQNISKTWIHWNMRDANYGFSAIEQRYKVLGGNPEIIRDSDKIDLSNLFIKLYGKGYIANPRIQSLMDKNKINPKNFLIGMDEAAAFDNKEYVKLSFSAARKVDVFNDFLTQATDNTLKVNSHYREIYGDSLWGLYTMLQDTNWGKAVLWILNLIIGGFIGAWISHIA